MIYQIGQPLGMNSECIMKVRTAETNIGLTIWMLCVILFTFSSEVPIELSQSERALPKNRRKRFRKKIRILVRTLKSKHDHESVLHRRKEQQNVLRGLSLCSSNRAPLPPPAPSPRTPHSARDVSQKRARGAGAGDVCSHQPQPSLVQLNDIATNQKHSYVSRPQAHHAGPPGGGGLPLPAAAAAAPFKAMKPMEHRAKTPKCIIFPHTDEGARKTIKKQ